MTTGLTHAERRQLAVDGLRKLRGDRLKDVEGGLKHTEDLWGATGSFTIDFVLADIWARPQLPRRDRSLIVLAALITIGADKELKVHTQGALNHGLTREQVEEVVTHVSAYAGFPRALAAIRTVQKGLTEYEGGELPPHEPAARKSDEERRRDGLDVLKTLMGWSDPEADAEKMEKRMGPLAEPTIQYLFGEVWARPQLSRRDRSLVTLSVLTVLGRTGQFPTHVRGALNHGLTREEIEEVMVHLLAYAGWPTAVTGYQKVCEIFAEIDKGG